MVCVLSGVTTHSTPSTHDAEKSFRDGRSGTVPIAKGAAKLQCTLQKTDIISENELILKTLCITVLYIIYKQTSLF